MKPDHQIALLASMIAASQSRQTQAQERLRILQERLLNVKELQCNRAGK